MTDFADLDPEQAKPWLTVPGDWRRPGASGEYRLIWDPARAYGQLWPRPAAEEVAAFYRVDYYTHEAKGHGGGRSRSLAQRLLDKASWLADRGVEPDAAWWAATLGPEPKRVLEVGCGNGTNMSVLAELGHRVTGVEPDPAALEVAHSKGHRVYQGTAEALPAEVSGSAFDAVIFMHVLEHCIHPGEAVRNATLLLEKGGLLICEVPNNACLGAKRFGTHWYWLDVPRHLNFFTEESLGRLLTSTGLTVETTCYRGFCRQFSESWQAAQSKIARTLGGARSRGYWLYLLETIWAPGAKKYDSVRLSSRL